MTVVLGDIIRVAARFVLQDGQDHVNVWHFKVTAGASDTDANAVADVASFLDSVYSNLSTVLVNTCSPVDMKVDLVEFVGGKETVTRNLGLFPFTLTSDPAAAGEGLPPGTAALLKLFTGIGKVYGRKFFGMLAEATQNNGVISGAILVGLDAIGAYLSVILTGTTLSYNAGVMSKKLATFVEFIDYGIDTVVAYQRRRRQGTGS